MYHGMKSLPLPPYYILLSPKMNLPIHDRIGPVSTPARVRILYINPNSTLAFTKETVDHLNEQSLLPPDVHIDFYTAPAEHAPPSIDGTLDGVISTAAILRDIGIIQNSQGRIGPIGTKTLEYLASTYTAIVVACFSSHPLVPCLREAFGVLEQSIVPSIVGIMEASIMVGMQMGPAFGIATTGTCKLMDSPRYLRADKQLGNRCLTKLSGL